MGALNQDEKLVDRMYHRAKADRWRVSKSSFARALEASAARMFAGRPPESRDLERYFASLHLEDLALACACAAGDDEAGERFVLEESPVRYRGGRGLDP